MEKRKIAQKVEDLQNRISRKADYIDTLRELKSKAEQRQQEAHEMANYPHQRYAEDWAREENHQAEAIKRLDEMMEIFSQELDDLCNKCEALRAKYNYYE